MSGALAFVTALALFGQPETPAGKVAVDFATSDPGSRWFVSSLEELVGREIGRFHRVLLVEKIDPGLCPAHDPGCLTDAYRKADVAILIRGTLKGTRLRYEVYDTLSSVSAFEGSLLAEHVTSRTLQRKIGDIIRPIVQRGGLVDQRSGAIVLTNAADIALPLAGGMLWGAFILLNLGFVFAPAYGLGRVRHQALGPLLRAWILLSAMRAILLLVYLPILAVTLDAGLSVGLSERQTVAIAMPAVGLLLDFLLLALMAQLALRLDKKLVIGPANERNPWHATIKRYFMGYVRRTGVELDPRLLEQLLFLPSALPYVASYGGGLSRPRILVGDKIREVALGELPDEDELPERTVNPDEAPLGFLIPGHGAADALRREKTHAPSRPRATLPRVIGEHATLLGWVMPQPPGQSVPLVANTREDFEVVKKLLTNHYSIFETNQDEDEIDDTDPSQLDLLFGAVLREVGAVRRHDSLVATLRHFKVLRPLRFLYDRLLSGPATTVADAYAALNHGLHHLIQYLYFLQGGRDLLTARADIPRLLRTSKEVFDRVGKSGREDRRLSWLSEFFYKPLALRRDRRFRLIGVAAFAILACAVAMKAAKDAIDYHPIYVERMAASNEGASDDRSTSP